MLYIVPALFIATFAVAAARREVGELFDGVPSGYTFNRQTIAYNDSSFEGETEIRALPVNNTLR